MFGNKSTLFMLAGFDTTATTLTNTCFQLARNPDIQEKLYDTVITKMEEYASFTFRFIYSDLISFSYSS